MAEPFLAEIRLMSFPFPPKGWALCNGQLLPINQNQALFALLGTQFGGNGQTNFALPDLRGRVPVHTGAGFTLGATFGSEASTVSLAQLPTHAHTLSASRTPASAADPAGAVLAAAHDSFGAADGLTTLHAEASGPVGGSQPHANMQPYLTLSYCIALQGIFPSPN